MNAPMKTGNRYRIGVDIGGTFTDIVMIDALGERATKKVSSTVGNYAQGIIDGISALIAEKGIADGEIIELLHATTVASNAILELKGARTGLITTKGFRDVLEIRTLRIPQLYDITWSKPPELVERRWRVEVDERINARGDVERPLNEADAERAIRRLLGDGVEAIAVCLLHSYRNPAHEQLVKRVASQIAPNLTLCISAEVLPQIKEYERASTTVINTYVRPIVEAYLSKLQGELTRIGVAAPVLLMQSNGGLTTARQASLMPMNIIESGPVAGVVGVQALARQAGIARAISFDMGGTTAKASIIEDGEVSRAAEYSVGGGIMIGSRLLSGAGYTLKVPAIDLAEVGAGGGSIISIDAGGAIQIGPRSAGAAPGPVCYDIGGTEPTLTDANVVLGYINPNHLVGGAVKLKADKARAAIEDKVARPLKISVEQAAYSAHVIAASNMMRAIRAVSSERGRDPRDYTLVGFGGNGPIFSAVLARTLMIPRIMIPPSAGVFSSLGLLYSDVEYHVARSHRGLLRDIDKAELSAIVAALESDAIGNLRKDGFPEDRIAITRNASLHYQGQSYELEVPVPSGQLHQAALDAIEEAFGAEHERTYGHRAGADEPVELVSVNVVGRGIPDGSRRSEIAKAKLPPDLAIPSPSRRAYFGPDHGWLEIRVLNRSSLAKQQAGPCIVEEYDSTCVIPPGCTARLDEFGNILIAVPPPGPAADQAALKKHMATQDV